MENGMVGWHHQLDGHGLGGLWELVMDREAWPSNLAKTFFHNVRIK